MRTFHPNAPGPGSTVLQYVQDRGLLQISDEKELLAIIDRVIAANPKQWDQFLKGKTVSGNQICVPMCHGLAVESMASQTATLCFLLRIAGKTKLKGFFVGQVMKESKGRANPGELNRLLARLIASPDA